MANGLAPRATVAMVAAAIGMGAAAIGMGALAPATWAHAPAARALAPAAGALSEDVYEFSSGSELSFVVSHALRKGVRGYSREITGSIKLPGSGRFELAQVGATVPVTTFVSHRAGLTQYMFSSLNAARHPQVGFRSKSIKVRTSRAVDGGRRVSGDITGMMRLHGVEKLVTTPFSALIKENSITTEATFDVKLSDFEVDRPRFLGLSVGDLVRVEARLEARR